MELIFYIGVCALYKFKQNETDFESCWWNQDVCLYLLVIHFTRHLSNIMLQNWPSSSSVERVT